MKMLSRAAWLLVALLFLAACSSGASPSPTTSSSSQAASGGALGFAPAPWQDGSTVSYVWQDSSDSQLGTSEFTFTKQANTWVITEVDKIGTLDQTSEITLDAQTLAPLSGQKTIKAPNTDATVVTTYQDGKVNIKATVNGQEQTASVSVPANGIDNDQSLMTFQALPFAEGYKVSYVDIVTQNALKINMDVTVQGQESVTAPAGTFNAWRVDWSTSQGTQTAWYEVEAPHTLVVYNNGINRMLLAK